MNMLLSLDTIPRMHNIYISFFIWILLAGFIIFPGTFTSLQSLPSSSLPSDLPDATTQHILHAAKNIPLLWIASFSCGIGAMGMLWLWHTHRRNYVWLLNKIFLPGCLNSVAGFVRTLVGVYGQQKGAWSITARWVGSFLYKEINFVGRAEGAIWLFFSSPKYVLLLQYTSTYSPSAHRITAIVTAIIACTTGILFVFYNFWSLRRVKSTNEKEMKSFDEGFVEKFRRKKDEPALEPGSVV
ncbi:uncharacterized protein EAE97_001561 [Botrytis byssoidea]|uniref:Uncharacterized protein n=1 Tax=Botrytis byssoidea TaxID=139641 RepID=A0A9P5IUG5_9HELO|nr:uncharacterized protein EAE97_001561 [Botrytis byssoidea]KAF7952064.1 hypothetical protein EAE97_001561 [Botrytis byssoidea]